MSELVSMQKARAQKKKTKLLMVGMCVWSVSVCAVYVYSGIYILGYAVSYLHTVCICYNYIY